MFLCVYPRLFHFIPCKISYFSSSFGYFLSQSHFKHGMPSAHLAYYVGTGRPCASAPTPTVYLTMISGAAAITAPSPSTRLSPAETKTRATVYSVVALKTVERCWPQTFGWRLCLGREKNSPSCPRSLFPPAIEYEKSCLHNTRPPCRNRGTVTNIADGFLPDAKWAHGVTFWNLNSLKKGQCW